MTPRDSSKWRAFYAAALGWLFDGYESYVLVLVAAVAVRDVISPTDLHDLPTYIGGLLGATLLGWATGGVLCGVLCDYIGRKRTPTWSICAMRSSPGSPRSHTRTGPSSRSAS